MQLEQAKKIAQMLAREVEPYCQMVKIAGSIRRGRAEVKDIELVVVPKFKPMEMQSDDLFQPEISAMISQLYLWAKSQTLIKWIKPGTSEIVPWEVKPDGKYWRGLVSGFSEEPVKLDLFIAGTNNFGVIYAIRTGSVEFSAALAGYIKTRTAYQLQQGNLVSKIGGNLLACPTEESFFENDGIQYVPVANRCSANPYDFLRRIEK